MLKNQVLRRKLIISKKNDFFKSSMQILFNRAFIDQSVVPLNPFYINRYVSKYSANFFSNALLKMKFPLEGKHFSNESIFYFEKLYKNVIITTSNMFLYFTSLNIFCIYNIFSILKVLTKILVSFLFILLCGMLFLSN